MSVRHLIAWLAIPALLLTGCSTYEPLSLHGAGSMRVEVEVYKGPVALSPEAQLGQATAVLGELVRAMDVWRKEATAFLGRYEGKPARPGKLLIGSQVCDMDGAAAQSNMSMDEWRDCQALDAAIANSATAINAACFIMNAPAFADIRIGTYLPTEFCDPEIFKETQIGKGPDWKKFVETPRKIVIFDSASGQFKSSSIPIGELPATLTEGCHDAAAKAAETSMSAMQIKLAQSQMTETLKCQHEVVVMALEYFATLLRSSAFRVSDAQIRYVPHSRDIRGLLASYSYMASEYGNQISSRTDTLRKRLFEGVDGKLQPTSDYLRGADNTDFIHLFEWLQGADKRYPIGSPGKLSAPERIRMAERLTSDYYWDKVNEVYASGQGEVSMAFVKDGLGNWDLKSFSNDPAELLAAYRKVTDAALSTAAKLASRAAGAPASKIKDKLLSAKNAAAFANQLAGGEIAADNAADVDKMHERVADRLRARKKRFADLKAQLDKEETGFKDQIANLDVKLQNPAANPEPAIGPGFAAQKAEAQKNLGVTQARLAALPSDAILAIRDILDDHQAGIVALQDGIVSATEKPAGKAMK